jgi:BirA family biotin operon repressor/biotin-[acetyl-CoA-carboxylase] ligase
LSVLLRPALELHDVVHVTCAAAVAVCRAVKKVYNIQLDIKWVNDLYRNGKKCGGILTEAVSDVESGGVEYIVVGIGLNLLEPAGGFAPEIADIATAILQPGETCWRGRLAATIANELVTLVNALPATRFMETYRARNIVVGKDVTILQNSAERPGHVLAITQEGHLRVRTEAGEEELSFGEVSIRLPQTKNKQEEHET